MSGAGDKKITYRNLSRAPLAEDPMRSAWVSPRGVSTNHEFQGLADPVYAVRCRPDGQMESVSLLPSAASESVGRATTVSPTGKYFRPTEAQGVWRREIPAGGRSLHDSQCQDVYAQMTDALRPLREAVEKGEVRAVHMRSLFVDPSEYQKLVAEYGFFVGDEALTRKLAGEPRDRVLTIGLTRGGWHYTGVDIDRNGRLDVLVAESANQTFFIYDLERMPVDRTLRLGQADLPVEETLSATAHRGDFSGAWEVRLPSAATPEGFITFNQKGGSVRQIEVSFYPFELVRSGASLAPCRPFEGDRRGWEEWNRRATDFTFRFPRLPGSVSTSYELPTLPPSHAWVPNSITLRQIRWASPDEGEILFTLDYHHQDRHWGGGQYLLKVPFTRTGPQAIQLSELTVGR